MSMRMEKINSQIKQSLADIVLKEIDDPAADLLSIVKVDTTPDLRECRVYYSLLDDKQYEHVQSLLEKMSKFMRHQLGKRVRLKNLPSLRFIGDDFIKYSVDIYQKIEDVKSDESSNPDTERDNGGLDDEADS